MNRWIRLSQHKWVTKSQRHRDGNGIRFGGCVGSVRRSKRETTSVVRSNFADAEGLCGRSERRGAGVVGGGEVRGILGAVLMNGVVAGGGKIGDAIIALGGGGGDYVGLA